MTGLGLKKKEIDAIEFAFDVYDFKGDGTVDTFYAGDLIHASRLNPTLKVGGQEEKRNKTLSKYKACRGSKNLCGFNDFDKILQLYERDDKRNLIGNEVFHLLTDLAEKLTENLKMRTD